jgi:hypothetical protein
LLLLAAGCGRYGTGRYALEGTVSLDGKSLSSGLIQFIPLPGTGGPSAGAKIENGKFSIDSEKGLFPGKFRVEITSVRKTGRQIKSSGSHEMTDEMRNFLPPRYNQKSQLTADVKDGGPNHFDFAVTAK